MSNILIAFKNLIENPGANIKENNVGNNRANNMGDGLEGYVKDLFSGSYGKTKEQAEIAHRQTFSFFGSPNNPPDMILKNSDAIEVKKIESISTKISLNSSYPKQKLESKSSLITATCKGADGGKWIAKDIIYSIGFVQEKKVKGLWFIYGDCYAAESGSYTKLKEKLVEIIGQEENIDFAETKEFARVNKVDPLKISYLRIRGMWGIENPIKVFDYLKLNTSSEFFSHIIMRKSKYDAMPTSDKDVLESLKAKQEKLIISQKEIKSPDNPTEFIKAVILSFNT